MYFIQLAAPNSIAIEFFRKNPKAYQNLRLSRNFFSIAPLFKDFKVVEQCEEENLKNSCSVNGASTCLLQKRKKNFSKKDGQKKKICFNFIHSLIP
jgi:hypothetical protein